MKICRVWNCRNEVEFDWKGKYKDQLYCPKHQNELTNERQNLREDKQ